MKRSRPMWHWVLCVALLPVALPIFMAIIAWRLALGAADAVDFNR